MARPQKTDNLTIREVWPVATELSPRGGIGVSWIGDIGFGDWVVYWGVDGKLHADTEFLDSKDDKRFTKAILQLLAEQIVIDG